MAKGEDITTSFKIDISDLKKGINQANQQIKLANAEFKKASAGMDDWAKSADGIKAKLKQLDSVLTAQKQKVQAYKEELARNEKAHDENAKRAEELRKKLQELAQNGVDKTSAEYKKYENELAAVEKEQEKNEAASDKLRVTILNQEAAVSQTEKEMRNYSKALEEVEDDSKDADKQTDELGDSVKKTGDKTEQASGGFTVMKAALGDLVSQGIQLAVQALKDLASAAVEAWEAFDEGRDTVIRLTGATGEFATEMTTAYANVSKQIVADSTDIGKAIGEVATRWGLTGDELESFALRYLQFSEITESDVISAIDDSQKALSAYGLNINSAKGFLDALAATSQKTGVDTGTLTKGLISNATAFEEMGLSIEQSVAFMGMLETSGANSETVLNGMRKALKNSTKDGKDLSTALIELENDIVNNTDSTKGLQAAYDVFGKSGDQIYGAVKNGSLSFKDLASAATDASGTVENTFAATKDATDDVKLTFQNLKTTVAETLDTFLQENGDQVTELLDTLSGEGLPKIVDAITAIANAILWVGNNLDWILPIIEAVTFGGAKTVEGLVVIFKNAWQIIKTTWSVVAKWFADIWQKIKNTYTEVKQWFSDKFSQAWAGIQTAWSSVTSWFSGVWLGIQNTFSNIGSWFGNKFTEAWTNIKNAFSNWGSFFEGLWTSIKTKFTNIGTNISNAISSSLKSGMNGVISSIERIINSGIGLINGAIGLINKIPGVNIGTISKLSLPRLAKGGVLERGQIGLLEGSGAEAVVPLSENKKWISAVASEMLRQAETINTGSVRNISNKTDYSFTQNIYAPAQPSRIELYRQTKNLLALAGAK